MEADLHEMTFEQLGSVIDIMDPCMDDYLYVYEIKTDRYRISPSALERFKLPAQQFTDVVESHRIFTYPDDIEMLVADLNRMVSGEQQFHNLEYRWLGKNGDPIWINCRGRVINDEEGKPRLMLGCINEIGLKQKADNVSGLLGESSLKQYMQSIQGAEVSGFVLRLGIDDFKDINEKKGIEYGDDILRHTAECIRRVILPGQMLFRLVADEFAVLDFMGGTVEEALELYKSIRREIDIFIRDNQYEVVYTISGGILDIASLEDRSYLELMKYSEFALDQSKRKGKNRCSCYQCEEYEDFLKRKQMIRVMRYSVNHDFEGFETYYQPIVSVEDRKLVSAETLLRFRSEDTGALSPVTFIPLLEESGLIIPVGRWVLRQAINMCAAMQNYIPGFKVSVNLSYVQVLKSDALKDILESLAESGLDPSLLIIELTESGFIEADANFTKFCKGLKEQGIALYLDDFGTGYSNFHYLYDIEPNTIKIDRSFTMKALKNAYENSLLKHIIDMIHGIQLKMCVEGIETEEELRTIEELGPDYIQGYYFGRPCPIKEFYEKYVMV